MTDEQPALADAEPKMIITGPDHYREACRLLHELRRHYGQVGPEMPMAEWEVFSPPAATTLIKLHTGLATAAAIGGLDAVEGPCSTDAFGRYSVNDAADWATAIGTQPEAGRPVEHP